MEEIWKDIEGYDGEYQISNFGRFKSFKGKEMRYLKPNISPAGYCHVILLKNNIRKPHYHHILVWDYFGGSKRDGRRLQIDHVDSDKLNNRIDNLQLLSGRDNVSKYHLATDKSSKYIGVCWHKSRKKYISRIEINGKTKHLGEFKNEYEAYLAYQKALYALDK